MRRFLLIAGALTIVLGLLAISCSDDDPASSSLSELQKIAIQNETTMMVGMMGMSFGAGFDYVSGGYGGLAKPADTSYYNDCWWVEQDSTYETIEDTVSGFSMTMIDSHIDSFSFRLGDTCQMFPDSTTTGLFIITSGFLSFDFGNDTSFTLTANIDSEFDGFTDVNTVIDGETDLSINLIEGSNELTFDYDGTYDDITLVNADLDGGDSHPIAGTASFALGFVDTEQDESFTVTIALTFSETGYHGVMTFEGETFVWDVTWEQVDAQGSFLGKFAARQLF